MDNCKRKNYIKTRGLNEGAQGEDLSGYLGNYSLVGRVQMQKLGLLCPLHTGWGCKGILRNILGILLLNSFTGILIVEFWRFTGIN